MKYVINITETLSRTVIIEAEDRYEAIDKVEELCNAGDIDLNCCDDWTRREIDCDGEATERDMKYFTEV